MNNREQYLKKQVERKDAQIALLLRTFENQGVENEYLTSVACAFAWDLVTALNDRELKGYMPYGIVLAEWDEAVKSVGG